VEKKTKFTYYEAKMIQENKFIGNEKKYLQNVLNSKSSYVQKLEKLFSKKNKVKYSIAVNSGTSALHACLAALNVGYGDEVIIPAHTVIMPSFVTIERNAKPVYADIDKDTFNISPQNIEKKITKKTKVIIAVHMHGLPADMKRIMKIARKHKIFVIEDAAQCLMGKIGSKLVGSFGDMCCYSFETKKHLCGFEGGMITTNNNELATKARKFAGLGYKNLTSKSAIRQKLPDFFRSPYYKRHDSMGLNYRMNEPTAAITLGQLENVNYFINRRINIAKAFLKIIDKTDWLLPQFVPKSFKHVYWTITLKYMGKEKFNLSWKNFFKLYKKYTGESFYAGLSVVPDEKIIKNFREIKKYQPNYNKCNFCKTKSPCYKLNKNYTCKNAYSIQPKLIQLKANHRNIKYVNLITKKFSKLIEYVNYNYK